MDKRFIRSIAILSGSNLLAQVINLITYFVLPRFFFPPEAFGVFGLFLAIFYVLVEVINLKMDQAIMLPEAEEDALSLMDHARSLALFLALVFGAIIWILNLYFHWLSNVMILCLTMSWLLGGMIQPAMIWLNRQEQYWRMGNVRVVQAVFTFGGSIMAYYLVNTWINGLIIGFLVGQLAATVVLSDLFWRRTFRWSAPELRQRYRQFVRFGTPSSLISTLSKQLPAFFIQPFYGEAALGWYTLATKYLNAPIGIFSVSVSQVYFKDASQADPGQLHRLTRTVIRQIILLAVLPVLIILGYGPEIFKLVFGPAWMEAGKIAQVLVLWFFVSYASQPVSVLLDLKFKLKWEMFYNVFLLISRACALSLALGFYDLYTVLTVYAFIGIIFNVVLIMYTLRISHEKHVDGHDT